MLPALQQIPETNKFAQLDLAVKEFAPYRVAILPLCLLAKGFFLGVSAWAEVCPGKSEPLIRSNCLERSRSAAIVEGTVVRVALDDAFNTRSIDPPTKRENVACLGANHEMLLVD
jgi:hypothetical protein